MTDKFIERRIIIGLIVSDEFCRNITPIYDKDYIEAKSAKMLAQWCLNYYKKYNKAPQTHIEDIYNSKVRQGLNEDLSEGIAQILDDLSEDFEEDKFNDKYLLDQTETYFKGQALKLLAQDITNNLSGDKVEEAEKLVTHYIVPEKDKGGWFDPFDIDIMREAFKETEQPLFKFPHALGKMLNDVLVRDSLISFQAPEKRGKTWWLMECAIRAARARCNVVFIQAGDMSQNQITKRMGIYAGRKSNKSKYCREIYIPVLDCYYNQTGTCKYEKHQKCPFEGIKKEDIEQLSEKDIQNLVDKHEDYKPCTECCKKNAWSFKGAVWYKKRKKVESLTWKEGAKAGRRLLKNCPKIHTSIFPNNTLSVDIIFNEVGRYEREEGFIADVIIIDYADLLTTQKRIEFRHQQNEIWKELKRLSQEKHALVITATQANAASYNQKSLNVSNFSEDKRKNSHVSAMYALNQTIEEKNKGLMRIAPLLVREDEFNSELHAVVLHCLQIGRPYIGSYFSYVKGDKE